MAVFWWVFLAGDLFIFFLFFHFKTRYCQMLKAVLALSQLKIEGESDVLLSPRGPLYSQSSTSLSFKGHFPVSHEIHCGLST